MSSSSRSTYIRVGQLGKAHGLRGELRFSLEEAYVADVLKANAILIAIGRQKVPYFIEGFRKDTLLKLEEVDDKTTASLLQHKEIYLPEQQVTRSIAPDGESTPYDALRDYTIEDVEAGTIGRISAIIDLPQHYLAEVSYQERQVLIPLHEDLIQRVDTTQRVVYMELPAGLLDL